MNDGNDALETAIRSEEALLSPEVEEALIEEEMSLPIRISRTYTRELEYRDKLVLAPMVRTGTREWILDVTCADDSLSPNSKSSVFIRTS